MYYKDTDFSTSIGWFINIISVNEITVFNCKFKLKPKMLLPYFFTVNFTDFFFLQCTLSSRGPLPALGVFRFPYTYQMEVS